MILDDVKAFRIRLFAQFYFSILGGLVVFFGNSEQDVGGLFIESIIYGCMPARLLTDESALSQAYCMKSMGKNGAHG